MAQGGLRLANPNRAPNPNQVIAFLEWAATRPQPLVGLADDDVFISLPMLAATARLLAENMQRDAEWRHLCVGSMEWFSWHNLTLTLPPTLPLVLPLPLTLTRFSWHNRTLVSSGYGRSLPQAMRLAQEPWRNCSPTGGGWTWTGWAYREAEAEADVDGERDFCHGPLAFARGPPTPLSPPTC